MSDEYKEIRKQFKDGDWVKGTNKHAGCSIVFDMDTKNPQPFSYLSETDPSEFRVATKEEIKAACDI